MKNIGLTIVLVIISGILAIQSYAQWIEHDPGFPEDMNARAYSVVDAATVWLLGGRALDSPPFHGFSRTKDGGQTWIYDTLDLPGLERFHFTDICALSDSLAWVSMMDGITNVHKGRIFKTTDGGQSWVHQSSAYPDDPVLAEFPDIVHFFNENDGLTAGEPGKIYITQNGGDQWSLVSPEFIPDLIGNEETLAFNSWSAGDSTLWFGTTKGRVFKTSDRGRTWEAYDVGLGISNVYSSFQDELTGLATAPLLGRSIAKTTNGGETWITLDHQLPSNGVLLHVSGSMHTYMFGSSGFATYLGKDPGSGISFDDGATWTSQNDQAILPALWANNSVGWAASSSSNKIYKWDGSPLSIREGSSGNMILDQNYPNPAGGNTLIRFTLEYSSPVKLSVYNSAGILVSQLMNERKGSGTHVVNFDASNLVSGVYYYNLLTNEGIQTRKMQILKQ